jgi:uncharacterized protein YoxC
MVLEICAILATLIFALLVFYIILTLKNFQISIHNLNGITNKLESKVDPLGLEAIRLLKNSNGLTETVQQDLDAFTPLCQAISNVSEALEDATEDMKLSRRPKQEERQRFSSDRLDDLLELAVAGLALWQQYKKRR